VASRQMPPGSLIMQVHPVCLPFMQRFKNDPYSC
jgi:hypothetical protein